MDLEQRQVIRRSSITTASFSDGSAVPAGRFLIPNRVAGPARPAGTTSGPRPCRDPVHPRAGGEDQVPAVLGLVDRVGVPNPLACWSARSSPKHKHAV